MRALEKLEGRAREVFAAQEREREDRALQETIERRAALTGARSQARRPKHEQGLKIGLIAGGGLLAFSFAYVTFALVLGVQPHEIPLVGKAFPAPAEPEKDKEKEPTPAAEPSVPKPAAQTASVGLLDVFQVESPYSTKELETLVADLKRKSKEFDQRLLELGKRESNAAERSSSSTSNTPSSSACAPGSRSGRTSSNNAGRSAAQREGAR